MSIVINRGQNSSGRAAPGFDFYTGMMFYGTAPSGWTTYNNPVEIKAKQILSATSTELTAAGILPNTDNTASTGKVQITHIFDTGDTIKTTCEVPVLGGETSIVTLSTYTVLSSATTIILQAAALAASINALTYLHGFTAVSDGVDTVTITAPKSYGLYLNDGNPYSVTLTSDDGTVTVTQNVVAGTASLFAAVYYHISEYYRKNPSGNLWIGFIGETDDFKETLALQIASGNKLRQVGILDTDESSGLAANLAATCTLIQQTVATASNSSPFEVVYQPNIVDVEDLSTLPNGQDSSCNNVQVIIGQDGLAQGNLLFRESGYSIGQMGANLGCLSLSRVSSSIAQPIDQNNISNGIENNTPGLANGQLLTDIVPSLYTQLFGNSPTNISGYCYVGNITYPGNTSGTYFSGNSMFCNSSSSYAYMNDNRVWDKITRICQSTYTPYLNSEVIFNSDGTINNASVIFLQEIGISAITASMITGYTPPLISGTPVVTIDPNQPLQATNVLQISVTNTENGIVRNIVITNGFSN